MKNEKLQEIISPEEIDKRIEQLAKEIDDCYNGESIVLVCVLKGACVFFVDLARKLKNKSVEFDFVRISGYGNNDVFSGKITFSKDLEIDINNKNVLVVEDIVDTGNSMRFFLDELLKRNPKTLRLAALIDNPERREIDVHVDFLGFKVEKGFLVGYGLDYAEKYRSLPSINEIIFE